MIYLHVMGFYLTMKVQEGVKHLSPKRLQMLLEGLEMDRLRKYRLEI